MKELVDGGGHPESEVDPLLVLLFEFVVLSSLDCAQIGFPLMRGGRTLAIWIKDRGNELGLAGSLSQCCPGLAQLRLLASSTYSNLESADMDSLYVVILKTYVNAYAIKM